MRAPSSKGGCRPSDLAHYRQELARAGARRARPELVPAPVADARLLAVPDRLDGHRPDQRDLPGALHALPAAPRPAAAAGRAAQRRVWGFFGDGEMDEPESIAGAVAGGARAARQPAPSSINCNLQRLDGPVRGNGRIVDELESLFAGAGWHVIKCLWSSDWDVLFARDHGHALMRAFAHTVDGQFQTLSAKDGAFNREMFFGQNPELQALVADMRDERDRPAAPRRPRRGEDPRRLRRRRRAHAAQPTVILAKTMKGYGMGAAGAGPHDHAPARRSSTSAALLRVPRPLRAAARAMRQTRELALLPARRRQRRAAYLHSRRAALGGSLPARRSRLRRCCRCRRSTATAALRAATPTARR